MASLFDRFRYGKEPVQQVQDDDPTSEIDYYSTHRLFSEPLSAIEARVFPDLSKITEMHAQAAGVAMDADYSSIEDVKQIFSLNNSRLPEILLSWYSRQGFIGYQACAVLSQQWLVNKACEVPGKDASRNGWNIECDNKELNEEQIAELKERDVKFLLSDNVVQFSKMCRVFGIRIAIFKVESDDPLYYEKPFNIDAVKEGKYQGISQIDPYWMIPELLPENVSDPSSIHFYDPTYWTIGGKKYHKSHLAIIRYSEVPDILKPSYLYGGMSLVQQIYERVYCAERSANEAPQLMLTKRMNVQKVALEKMVADPANFKRKMELSVMFRDNYGRHFIGEDEEYQQHETSLGDVDDVIMTQYQLVAAVANVPATRLLETSPKGFNATGDNEQRNYRQHLKTIQTHEMDLILQKHYRLLAKSEMGVDVKSLRIDWNPTDEPTSVELADLNAKKADYYLKVQETGAVDAVAIADALNKDKESGFNGLEVKEADLSYLDGMLDEPNQEPEDKPKSSGNFGEDVKNYHAATNDKAFDSFLGYYGMDNPPYYDELKEGFDLIVKDM